MISQRLGFHVARKRRLVSRARPVVLVRLGLGVAGIQEVSLTYRCIFRSSEVIRQVRAEDRLVHLESRAAHPQA